MVPKPNSEKSLYVCFSLQILWIWQLRWSSLHTLVVYHKSILILNFSKYATCKSASKSITLAPHCHQMNKHLWNPAQQASFPSFTAPCTKHSAWHWINVCRSGDNGSSVRECAVLQERSNQANSFPICQQNDFVLGYFRWRSTIHKTSIWCKPWNIFNVFHQKYQSNK